MSNFTHGWSGYSNYGCRCDTCTQGWAKYHLAAVRRHPEYADRKREGRLARYYAGKGRQVPDARLETCPDCGREFRNLNVHRAQIRRRLREGKAVRTMCGVAADVDVIGKEQT